MFVTLNFESEAVVVELAGPDEWFALANVVFGLIRNGLEVSLSTNSDQSGLPVVGVEDVETMVRELNGD